MGTCNSANGLICETVAPATCRSSEFMTANE
jgi:hypothetical protein